MYKDLFDKVAAEFCKESYEPEFREARLEYENWVGRVFEDEAAYETYISGFLEWFLFDRELYDYGIPPIRLYQLYHESEISAQERRECEKLEKSRRSLFLVSDHAQNQFDDLLASPKQSVRLKGVGVAGVENGQILDARLVDSDGEAFFTESTWIHPRQVNAQLKKEARKYAESGKKSLDFVLNAAYMKWRRDRYPQVDLSEIYNLKNVLQLRKESGDAQKNGH